MGAPLLPGAGGSARGGGIPIAREVAAPHRPPGLALSQLQIFALAQRAPTCAQARAYAHAHAREACPPRPEIMCQDPPRPA